VGVKFYLGRLLLLTSIGVSRKSLTHFQGDKKMNLRRLLIIVPLLVAAFALTTSGLHYRPVVNAQETKTDSTTGYPTGTKCPRTGTYRATNNKIEIVLVVVAGKPFPPFSDGSKTIWYPVKEPG